IDTVLSAYSTGRLLNLGSDVATHRPGTLAIVLTGPAPAPTADPSVVKAQQDFVLELARDLDETALGAVLAAPRPASGSTTAAGQIATVFALAAQADGTAGRYGPQSQLSPLPASSVAP